MIDGQILRRDTDVLPFTRQANEKRIAQLRQHLSPRDARLFGIDEAYEANADGGSLPNPLLRGLGATLASATLFVTIGALALPAAAFA